MCLCHSSQHHRLCYFNLYMTFSCMSALLPEALQQMNWPSLQQLLLQDTLLLHNISSTLLFPTSKINGKVYAHSNPHSNPSPDQHLPDQHSLHIRQNAGRILLQTHNSIINHGWTHNRTSAYVAETHSHWRAETSLLAISMTAVCTCLITIIFMFHVYGWHKNRTEKKFVTVYDGRIGRVDQVHGAQKEIEHT